MSSPTVRPALIARLGPLWPAALALAAWVPLAMEVLPVHVPGPMWPYQVVLGLLGLGLLVRTPHDPAARRAPANRTLLVRSAFGAFALGVATLLHLVAGGGAFFVPNGLFLGAALVLGVLLGPLAVFERHAAARPAARGRDALAALLTGWGVFLALCVGWVQARYARELLSATSPEAALQDALKGLQWITEDPLWTLRHFGWAALPGAAFAWSRLRGWSFARQLALCLAAPGALWGLFAGQQPAVTFGMCCLGIGLPVISRVADIRRETATPVEPARDGERSWAWLAAVAACALWAAGLGAREGWRAWRRAELDAIARARVPALQALVKGDVAAVSSDRAQALVAAVKEIDDLRDELRRNGSTAWDGPPAQLGADLGGWRLQTAGGSLQAASSPGAGSGGRITITVRED